VNLLTGIRSAEWIMIAITIIQTVLVTIPLWQYFAGEGDRLRTKHYQAWQVIALANGRGGDGGRRQALQDLQEDGIALRGIEIPGAILDSLQLPGAGMKRANLRDAILTNATLTGAKFGRATLTRTRFVSSSMQAGDLSFARADSAVFNGTALCTALMIATDLRGAQFVGARLDGVNFRGADLRGARFGSLADATGITFRDANVAGMRAPDTFIRAALANGAVVMDSAAWAAKHTEDEPGLKKLWADIPNPYKAVTQESLAACPPAPGY
ncbi:MAG TPA: pentapeptide repeat-containing protein, partial [Longimicrobium sp.]|nr:pentapeptide repeat-containing protein [Longimicrobium sp.]